MSMRRTHNNYSVYQKPSNNLIMQMLQSEMQHQRMQYMKLNKINVKQEWKAQTIIRQPKAKTEMQPFKQFRLTRIKTKQNEPISMFQIDHKKITFNTLDSWDVQKPSEDVSIA
ncbi:hypothetical protein pb186bvf_019499 [Paramecium bursaria]